MSNTKDDDKPPIGCAILILLYLVVAFCAACHFYSDWAARWPPRDGLDAAMMGQVAVFQGLGWPVSLTMEYLRSIKLQ